jgi:hypothetical protein
MSGAAEALDLPFDEALDYLRQKTAVPSQTWTDIWRKANVRSFTVAGAASQALVDDFRREVIAAAERGETREQWRARFDDVVRKHGWSHTGKPGWRARVIYETNLAMAYSAGRHAQMTDPATLEAFPYWQYVHSGARHPRLQHLNWNGMVLRADDPFWSWAYPPNGWGCGCSVRVVSEGRLRRMGRTAPDKAPERVRTQMISKKTGEVLKGSEGVDYGFDYNPGAEWKKAVAAPPATVGRKSAVTAAASAPIVALTPTVLREFATSALAKGARKSDVINVMRLPDDVADALGIKRGSPVELSVFRVAKVAGRAEDHGGKPSNAHPEIGADEWALVPDIIRDGSVHVPGGDDGTATMHRTIDSRTFMLALKAVRSPERGDIAIIRTFSGSGRRRKARVLRGQRQVRAEKE